MLLEVFSIDGLVFVVLVVMLLVLDRLVELVCSVNSSSDIELRSVVDSVVDSVRVFSVFSGVLAVIAIVGSVVICFSYVDLPR